MASKKKTGTDNRAVLNPGLGIAGGVGMLLCSYLIPWIFVGWVIYLFGWITLLMSATLYFGLINISSE